MTHGVMVVGLGAIGMGYDLGQTGNRGVRTHAGGFTRSEGFTLLAGVDPDEDKRQTFETNYAAPGYASVEAALAKHDPSIVVIACPTVNHQDSLNRVLALATPRMILCEKPLAPDAVVAHAMVGACKERRVALYVNYMRRADPGVATVKRMIEQQDMLAPFKGVVWYSKGLVHNGSHFVDLMRFWLGAPQAATLIHPGRLWDGRDPEPDFRLDYTHGSVIYLAAREEFYSHYDLELLMRNGRLRYERGGARVEWQGVINDPEFPSYRVLTHDSRLLPADMSHSQLHVVQQLAAALAGKACTLCSGEEALENLRDIRRVIDLIGEAEG